MIHESPYIQGDSCSVSTSSVIIIFVIRKFFWSQNKNRSINLYCGLYRYSPQMEVKILYVLITYIADAVTVFSVAMDICLHGYIVVSKLVLNSCNCVIVSYEVN